MPEVNTSNLNIQANDLLAQKAGRRSAKVIDQRNGQLDKSSFLKLLIKQLQHQDPLEPVNDREFIAQMAQFSALEQMHNVANSMDSLRSFQANFLLGKYVTGKDFVTRKSVGGVVSQIIFDAKNQVFLRVNGRRIRFSDLTSVNMPASVQDPKQDQTTGGLVQPSNKRLEPRN